MNYGAIDNEPVAVRVWDSDGSTNLMPLGIAVRNVVRNVPGLLHHEVRQALLRGEKVGTRLATFHLEGKG